MNLQQATTAQNGNTKKTESPTQNEHKTFGQIHFQDTDLGDSRRTKRLVRIANTLTASAGDSFPQKLKSPAELQAFYRLFNCEKVTHQCVLKPHIDQTLRRINSQEEHEKILVLHDMTELDYTKKTSLANLGQIGNGNRRGYLCQNALAIDAKTRDVIGLTNQILHCRPLVGKKESQKAKRERESRESRLWLKSVSTLPASKTIVDLCDQGADTFEFLEHEFKSGRFFVIRSKHNRSIRHTRELGKDCHGSTKLGHLRDFVCSLPSQGEKEIFVSATKKVIKARGKRKRKVERRTARKVVLSVSFSPVLINAPTSKKGEHGDAPLPLWCVRVWEETPPEGETRLEWFLLTNSRVESIAEALEVIGWYECRWVVEEYHKSLKTGCKIEEIQFTSEERQQPVIALLSVVAISLLNLRTTSRSADAKTRRASDLIPASYVAILSSWRYQQVEPDWSVYDFYFALARMGGHQNRKNDHPPGWQCLWHGWTHLQQMHEGAQILKSIQEKCAQT